MCKRRIRIFGPKLGANDVQNEVNKWLEESDINVESGDIWLSTENDDRFKDRSQFITVLVSYTVND